MTSSGLISKVYQGIYAARSEQVKGTKLSQRISRTVRSFAIATLSALVILAGLALPNSPFEGSLPEAEAQVAPTSSHTFSGCAFRQSTSTAIKNDDLCWLDFRGVTFPRTGTGTYAYSKTIGRYTLKMNISQESFNAANSSTSATANVLEARQRSAYAGAWGNNVSSNGYDYYVPFADDTSMPVISTTSEASTRTYLNFTNISLTDENNVPVTGWRMFMADAEQTTAAETLQFDDRSSTSSVSFVQRVTPNTWNAACPSLATPGWDVTPNGSRAIDVECKNVSTPSPMGTFLASSLTPTRLTTGFITATTQAAAFAIGMGRTGGDVNADTAFEKSATGQNTTFDLKMYSRVGTTDSLIPNLKKDTYVANVRPYDSSWNPADVQVFKSTASGVDKAKAFSRYQPIWSCIKGQNPVVTITEGQPVPAGYTLKNDPVAGTSEVSTANLENNPIRCSVYWKERFTLSSLQLSKTVSGNGASSEPVDGKTYSLDYTCTDPGTTVKFTDAYATALKGSKVLSAGQTGTPVTALPAGSTCTISESNFPQPPGQTLTTTYSKSNTITLVAGANSVSVTNNYEIRTATLNVSKSLTGSAFAELDPNMVYNFEIACPSVHYNRTFTVDVNRVGTTASGSNTVPEVPIGVDCSITPLTGLSTEQSKYIKFDGRTVAFNGTNVTLADGGGYHFTIPDQANPPADLRLVASYSYQLRDLKVVKELGGPAAGLPALAGKTYPVQYSCTTPDKTSAATANPTGTLNIQTAATNPTPAVIPNLPVRSTCLIWEQDTPPVTNLVLKSTTLTYGNSFDQVTTLTNNEAKSAPIATVDTSTDPNMNKVIVRNNYDYQLGQVNLQKLVNANGLQGLPTTYSLSFDCGTRSVLRAAGSVESVALKGNLTIDAGQTQPLRMSLPDAELQSLVNDQGGNLGIPYGNTCDFTEASPTLTQVGVLWSTDVAKQSVTVGQSTTTQTITNAFTPAGNGLTVSQVTSAGTELSQDITYNVSCTNNGQPVALDAGDSTFTLSSTTPTHTIPASAVPKGTICALTESSTDPGTRAAKNGTGTFAINRDATVSTPGGTALSFDLPEKINAPSITVGDSTVVDVNLKYAVPTSSVSAKKTVAFDPATEQYISSTRKTVKRERLFNLTIVCTDPVDGSPSTFTGQFADVSGPIVANDVMVGSRCTVTEGDSTTAAGITLKRQVTVGGTTKQVSNEFTVGTALNKVDVTNYYSRRLTSVDLNKKAFLPGNIDPATIKFYTHNFTMKCYDPETDTSGPGTGTLLATYTSTITGAGSTSFTNVPVGAECQITGDNFGQLDVANTAPDGVELKAHLKPKYVDWVVDNNDGQTFRDDNAKSGTTTSQFFNTLDASTDGTKNNVVDLKNYYDYTYTTMSMTKQVVGKPEDLAFLDPNQAYNFNYTCRGVGYTYTTIGVDKKLSPEITAPQFTKTGTDGDGNDVYQYTSPVVVVPTDSYCTFTEAQPTGIPVQLTWKADQQTIDQRVSATEFSGDTAQTTIGFVNRYDRRMVPVRVQNMQIGYVIDENESLDVRSYQLDVVCTDPLNTSRTVTYTIPESDSRTSVADPAVPMSGGIVELPVGADCTLDLSNSTALQARPSLAMTAGDRRPFTQFATWINGVAQPGNPPVPPGLLAPAAVTPEMKQYSYDFSVPGDIQVSSITGVAMTVGAETAFLRDRVPVKFTKKATGDVGADAVFSFQSNCAPQGTFSLRSGESVTFDNISVDTSCLVEETSDGVNDNAVPTDPSDPSTKPHALIGAESWGPDIAFDPAINIKNFPGDANTDPEYSWSFGVKPVSNVADASTPSNWTFVATNTFPSISIQKTIDGGPLSALGGPIADTAILQNNATSMNMHYSIKNTGGLAESSLKLVDPSLAGMTITANGTQYVVPADGLIDPAVCATGGVTLQPGQTLDCAFSVAIPGDDPSSYYKYDGKEVTVQATTSSGVASATSTYNAIRPPYSLSWMLPQTGMQTLVWALVLGLIAVGFGLWRYLRNKDDESEVEVAEEE